MDGVGKTSLLTAAMRAVETNRREVEGRLFVDPYAELLAGVEGKELLRRGIEAAGDQPAIALRTAFMDQKILAANANGILQIVMLAAGMDTRSYRLPLVKGTVIFELDRAEIFKYKNEKLKNIASQCRRHEIVVDLRHDWIFTLKQAGFEEEKPTLWLIEGLLMYLCENDVYALLERVSSLAASGDELLMDILSRTLLESPFMEKQLNFLKDIGAPWRFGEDEPEVFLKKYDWNADVMQTGEVAPHRWPFPITPRNVPGLPRGFLVHAIKQ
ncbi:MAG: SAM-dependent methyltransferase [Bdellovibrionaceae bacterium]|nr:SAM-dependent methyltransferase [Pseudobdellovibrionaceae bacterium]